MKIYLFQAFRILAIGIYFYEIFEDMATLQKVKNDTMLI